MRRKRKHNGGTIIDLTSLLDVIFVVLLVVICYACSLNENYSKIIDENKSEQNELKAEKETYQKMNNDLKNLIEFVGVISIRVPYDEGDYTKRTVHILENGEEEIQKYPIAGNRKIKEQSDLYQYLEKYIVEHDEKPVVISFNDNDEDILYRDEMEITEIINSLRETYNNIYIN